MNSNILFFSLFLPSFHTLSFTPINMHTLCWMSCLSSSKRKKKLTCQYSLVRSGLTFEMLIALMLYRLLDTSMRRSDSWCICCLSFPFSLILFPLNPFRVVVGKSISQHALGERQFAHAILIPSQQNLTFILPSDKNN